MAKLATLGRSDFAVWSFDAMKVITTGDGGLLWCKDPAYAAQARQDFCLGVDSGSGMSSKKPKWWEFFVEKYGVGRHLMNDTQAAMGLAQLRKLSGLVARRLEIVELYKDIMGGWTRPFATFQNGFDDPYYFFWVSSPSRNNLATWLREREIYTSFRYWPLHLAYNTGVTLPHAERAARENLLLPLHANLSNADVRYVCETIKEFYVRD